MGALVPTSAKVVDLSHLKMRLYYVTSVADTNTLVTGVPGIKKVFTITGSGSSSNFTSLTKELSGSSLAINGTASALRRVQAFLTNAATGEITFDVGATGTAIVMTLGGH